MVLRLWTGSPNTNICQGRKKHILAKAEVHDPVTHHQQYHRGIPSSSLPHVHLQEFQAVWSVTLQLALHTFKVVQSIQYYIVCTDRLHQIHGENQWQWYVWGSYEILIDFGLLSGKLSVHATIGRNITFKYIECASFWCEAQNCHHCWGDTGDGHLPRFKQFVITVNFKAGLLPNPNGLSPTIWRSSQSTWKGLHFVVFLFHPTQVGAS